MRKIIFLALLLPVIGLGQITDTTCIKSRWIALKAKEINKNIFLLDSTVNENLDLVFTIKRLVESDKVNIYNRNSSPNGNSDINSWYYIDYDKEMEENLKDSSIYWSKDPYFEIIVNSDYPMVDEYGDDLIVTLPDGTQSYKYPLPDIYIFPSKECDEIRIKEDRIFNDETNEYEFIPVGLSFYFKGSKYWRGHEKFWVDLNELFNALDNKNEFPWYETIINREYEGFQYMQVSCFDDEIKN